MDVKNCMEEKKMETFAHQILREVIKKEESHTMADVFEEKYK